MRLYTKWVGGWVVAPTLRVFPTSRSDRQEFDESPERSDVIILYEG